METVLLQGGISSQFLLNVQFKSIIQVPFSAQKKKKNLLFCTHKQLYNYARCDSVQSYESYQHVKITFSILLVVIILNY